MNSEFQKRLYEMEVMPPAAVWEKLSVNIDEINADNSIAKKVFDATLTPPAAAWENISIAIGTEEKKEPTKKGVVINFRRLAAAAIFIGVVITAWIVFRNNKTNDTLAGVQNGIKTKTAADSNSSNEKKVENIQQPDLSSISIATINPETINKVKRDRSESNRNNRIYAAAQTANVQYASLNSETPGGNSFGQSIDDLSLVTADQNYLTMVNANGRLVKIPAQFANLAPHLQNKPVSEDYYEVMFGEGAYWKETLNEWRKKVASLPVSSGDAFTSFIELLKTVQDK
jgi:hypothetical protein